MKRLMWLIVAAVLMGIAVGGCGGHHDRIVHETIEQSGQPAESGK